MKPNSIHFLIVLLATHGVLRAQVVPGSVSAVTLALTTSITGSETQKPSGANTVETGIIETTKLGNVEFLSMLNQGGKIPDGTTSGWKLVIVNKRPLEDLANESGDLVFYLVKTGKTPVSLAGILDINFGAANASTYTETLNGGGLAIAGTSTFKTECGLSGVEPVDHAVFSMTGVMSGKSKTSTVKIGSESFLFNQQVVSAKIASISGHLDDAEDTSGDDLLIEGTVTLAAGVPTDISNF